MKAYEDLARLRVDEAIQRGLEAQRHRQAKVVRQTKGPDPVAASARGAASQAVTDGRRVRRSLKNLLAAEGARFAGAVWIWAMARMEEK